jgi:dihydrofolate reductase
MKHFRELTTGKTVVMGRKTYESIGKPLPNRKNVVLTRDTQFKPEGITVYSSVDEVVANLSKDEEVCIIGGATIYKEFLPQAEIIHFTLVEGEFPGDTFLPTNIFDQFELKDEVVREKDETNPLTLRFRTYKRK